MNAQAIDLKPFCSSETGYRYPDMVAPIAFGGWEYATDTHIAIRVPRQDSPAEPSGSAKVVANLGQWKKFPLADAVPLPAVDIHEPPPVVLKVCKTCDGKPLFVCPECNGHGEVEWDGNYSCQTYSDECKLCDSMQWVTEEVWVKKCRLKADRHERYKCDECGDEGVSETDAPDEQLVELCGMKIKTKYYRLIRGLGDVRVKATGVASVGHADVLLFECGEAQGLVMGHL